MLRTSPTFGLPRLPSVPETKQSRRNAPPASDRRCEPPASCDPARESGGTQGPSPPCIPARVAETSALLEPPSKTVRFQSADWASLDVPRTSATPNANSTLNWPTQLAVTSAAESAKYPRFPRRLGIGQGPGRSFPRTLVRPFRKDRGWPRPESTIAPPRHARRARQASTRSNQTSPCRPTRRHALSATPPSECRHSLLMPRRTLIKRNSSAKPAFESGETKKGGRGKPL